MRDFAFLPGPPLPVPLALVNLDNLFHEPFVSGSPLLWDYFLVFDVKVDLGSCGLASHFAGAARTRRFGHFSTCPCHWQLVPCVSPEEYKKIG